MPRIAGRQRGVVTFDLWHTLLDLAPFAESEYMRRQWSLGGETVAEAPPGPLAAGLERPMDPFDAFRRSYDHAVAAAREGATVTPAEQLRRAASWAARRPNPERYEERLRRLVDATPFRAVPRAKEVLESLRTGGYRIGLISNTIGEPGRFFRPTLDKYGLTRSFDAFVWSDEHPWTKPAPQLFRFALDALRSNAADAVHIGDGASDILGAQGVGYRATILFEGSTQYAPEYRALFASTPAEPLTPTHRARRLEEIPGLVDRELQGRPAEAPQPPERP